MESMSDSEPQIKIERPVYEHHQLRNVFDYQKKKSNCAESICAKCREVNVKKSILATIPALKWLSHYKWKRDIISDLLAGFTVAIMHIPQGMAYALLGNVSPVIGIYMAFFPVLVYFFLGTSKHNSMGTFAVVCLMTGKAVLEHSHPSYFPKTLGIDPNTTDVNVVAEGFYSPTEVATAVTFSVALFQIAMYILRLGAVSALLSETLVSGFTTGAAFHVVVSQIKDLLGLHLPRHKGYFVIIQTLRSIFDEINTTNYAALVISVTTIIISSLNNEILKPVVAKKTSIPIPIELIAIVVGALVSKYCNLEEVYNIRTVGEIPQGLPVPKVPSFELMSSLVFDAFTISIVSYTITLSMALIFAQKLNYEVDANQELLAQGAGNLVGSFFSCMPFAASLSRSSIQQTVGGKSQIASVVSCSILLFILFWIGPFFEPLPKAVLASVIVVALKGMIFQAKDFLKFLKFSKMDALVWMTTFLTVIFISIDIGLLVGIIMSLCTIFVLSFKPYTCLLGSVPCTDIYMDINRYKRASEITGLKIFHYRGGLNFATRNIFKTELINMVGINPQKEIVYRKKLAKLLAESEQILEDGVNKKVLRLQDKVHRDLRCLILDFSSLSYIDPSGVSMLQNMIDSFQKIAIPIYISACSEPIYEKIQKCGLIDSKNSCRLFPTVHDAVKSATEIFSVSSNASSLSTISRL